MAHLLAIYQDYLTVINLALALLPWDNLQAMLQVLHQARMQRQTVFVIGSGSSANVASHLAHKLDDLEPTAYGPQFRVMALVDSTPTVSLWGEERSYNSLFSRLIIRLQAGDVVIAVSAQPTPPEVLRALRYARGSGGFTIGLGSDQDSRLSETVNLPILVPEVSPDQAEDIFQMLVHMLVRALREYDHHRQFRQTARWRIMVHRGPRRPRHRYVFLRPRRIK